MIITSRGINIKIVTLGRHAFNYVPIARLVHIDLLAPLVKAIGFFLASCHVCSIVWRTANQANRQKQNYSTFDVLHCSATQLLTASNPQTQ